MVEDDQYYLISACKGTFALHIYTTWVELSTLLDNNPMLRDGITGDWSVSIYLLGSLFANLEAGSALSWATRALCGKLDFQQMQQLRQPLRQISLRM